MTTVLIVDDDELNAKLIQLYLKDTGYQIVTAVDGVEGWDKIQQLHDKIDVVLLDRNMPNMDGMQFLQRVKREEVLARIPVIMQTAATAPNEVSEGVKAGVFYYLAKPYEKEILLSLVDAALSDFRNQKALYEKVQQQKHLLNYVEKSELSFRTLKDAQTLAPILATFFPQPQRVILGISELLINAVEHGNAGISYDEKTDLNHKNSWREEVNLRLALEENRHKRVRVCYEKTKDMAYLTIIDEGPGFDWEQYLDIDPQRASNNHGRGIAMSNLMSFDSLEYKGCGNHVVCAVKLAGSIDAE